MGFLGEQWDGKNIIPLHVYYTNLEEDKIDFVDIIFKDIDTNTRYVHTILNPTYVVYIVKPEYRTFTHIRNFIPMEHCYPFEVKYRNRMFILSKELGCAVSDVRYSPYLAGYDVQLDHYYMMKFIQDYPVKNTIGVVSSGFLDIETDIISIEGFPEPGEVPINCITYINGETRQVYTLVLTTDDLPVFPPAAPEAKNIEKMRQRHREGVDYLTANAKEFIAKCREEWDESHGEFTYHLYFFDKEIELLKAIFKIVHTFGTDFIEVWNIAFDMDQLVERMRVLGYRPEDIIIDPVFKSTAPGLEYLNNKRTVYFKEDTNVMAHKRSHNCHVFTTSIWIDQMVIYAGVRAHKGKLPSVKLGIIAQTEIKDDKLNYSEIANIRTLPYVDFPMYVKYNIKDVLLQYSIEERVEDLNEIYARMYDSGIFANEVFRTVRMLENRVRMFVLNLPTPYVMGSNRAKLFTEENSEFKNMISKLSMIPDDADIFTFNLDEFDEDDEEEVDDKDDKFDGAFVQNPNHIRAQGMKVFNSYSNWLHEWVCDLDIKSEYPSCITTCDISNETLVGRVFLKYPEEIREAGIPSTYDAFPAEIKKYKPDPSALMMEYFTQSDWLSFGSMFLNLPTVTEVFQEIDTIVNIL